MTEEKPLDRYLRRIAAAETARRPREALWERWNSRWRNQTAQLLDPETGRPVTDRSNISIPYTFSQVETILPRLVQALFPARPYVTVRSRYPSDGAAAVQHETLLDWQMTGLMNFPGLFHGGLKSACIYGTAVAYTGWKWEQRRVVRREKTPGVNRGRIGVETREIIWDDPEVRFLDLAAFFVDPSATDIGDARYCGHSEHLTREQVLARVEAGVYDLGRRELAELSGQAGEDELIEVIHYWEDDRYAVILGRSRLVRDGPNPFWHGRKPYCRGVYCLAPGDFYGVGIPEILNDLQDELNAERNMRIDYRAFVLRRMFKVRRGSVVNWKQLKWRQGGIIEVDAPEDVTEMGVGDRSGSSFTAESGIKDDMQETTGGHDVIMGITDARETATAIRAKDRNAGLRFELIVAALKRDLLAGVAAQMLELNRQFLTGEKVFRTAGGYAVVSEAELEGEFDVEAREEEDRPGAEQLLELYRTVSGDTLYAANPEGKRELLVTLLKSYGLREAAARLAAGTGQTA